MARKHTRTGKPRGGARPGSGRKPKPADPVSWVQRWKRIDDVLCPKALDIVEAALNGGDEDMALAVLRMAGMQRPYEAAAAEHSDGNAPSFGGGLSVTMTVAAPSTSSSSPDSSESSTPSSASSGRTSQ